MILNYVKGHREGNARCLNQFLFKVRTRFRCNKKLARRKCDFFSIVEVICQAIKKITRLKVNSEKISRLFHPPFLERGS